MLTDEDIIKLQNSLDFRGMKDDRGIPVNRYAFMKKKHMKRIVWQRCYKLEDGRNFYVRVFK